MKVSALWITKNEAANIARSIDSVRDAVDEMIVVDTGSQDDTVAIARERGARTEFFQWIGDFSAARNYAMEQTDADIVIFIDADESFVPVLDRAGRDKIERMFAESKADLMKLPQYNVDQYGTHKSTANVPRVYAKKPGLAFHNKVHETYMYLDKPCKDVVCQDWNLYHTGYQETVQEQKVVRNLELLEDMLANAESTDKTILARAYLMRENGVINNNEEAYAHMRAFLELYSQQSNAFKRRYEWNAFLYEAMRIAQRVRGRMGRREVYDTIVTNMQRVFPSVRGTVSFGLFYGAAYDLKEDAFLREVGPALAEEAGRKDDTYGVYLPFEMSVRYTAAQALVRRGRQAEALEYMLDVARSASGNRKAAIQLILWSIRDQLQNEIVLFLNSVLEVDNPDVHRAITTAAMLEGFQDLFAYYQNRAVEAGTATHGDFLYLLLVLGKVPEAVQHALTLAEDGETAETAAEMLFLAALCGDSEAIFREHARYLGDYTRILEAWFSGTPIPDMTEEELVILTRYYHFVAFAAGVPAGDRLLAVLARPVMAYCLRTDYLLASGRADTIAQKGRVDILDDDYGCLARLVRACIDCGRDEEAYEHTLYLLERGDIQDELLHNLLVVAERAPGNLGRDARELYDRYLPVLDDILDLGDVVSTGYVADTFSKKQLRALQTLTPVQFDREQETHMAAATNDLLLTLLVQAGDVYREKEMPGMAQQCYRRALAKGAAPAETVGELAGIYRQLGNQALAAHVEKLAV